MADRIQLKRSDVPGRVPVSTDLAVGELAVNTADGRLFVKLADGSVAQVGGGGNVAVVRRSQLFTANGTWTRPANMAGSQVRLTGIAGGASGRNTTTPQQVFGGDGGQYVIDMALEIGTATSVSVTIGAGGAPSATGAQPNHGAPTSFGTLLTLLGGVNRGTSGAPAPVGAPGGRGDNPSTMNGSDTQLGYGGRLISNLTSGTAGGGGGLKLDGTLVGGGVSSSSIAMAQGYGAGGSGSGSGNSGAGAPGALLIEWDEVIEL